ncbi:hypothetical protein L2E82_14858 [Cichorium intybus]|uniref:Uncharacterized protein n=1 Tax=Cichorium intybus TaxID=13427 RepID=A0ACB9F1J7_CICIN|nr:hypothetical protein L2E82_14858 [Cichorium intybus]
MTGGDNGKAASGGVDFLRACEWVVIYGLQYDDRVQLISGVPMIVQETIHLEKEAKFDHGPYEPTKDEKYSEDMHGE